MYSSIDDYDLRSTSDKSEDKTDDDSDENEDKIDSDIEVALYSQIHHQENPLYEPSIDETENLLPKVDHNNDKGQDDDQNNDKDQSVDNALNKDNVTPFTITISDESDVCNVDDTNSSDVQFICETKNVNENECEMYDDAKNHRNKWWENFVSATYNDDDDDGNILFEEEKNSDGDNIYEKTKLKQSYSGVVLPCKNKRTMSSPPKVKGKAIKRASKQKPSDSSRKSEHVLPCKNKQTMSSPSKRKNTAIKRVSKQKLSDDSEEDAFKHHQRRKEGKGVLINVKPSVVTVDLTKDNDLWQLSSKDIYNDKQTSRYYNKKSRITCNNCSEKGHISRDCKMPRKLPVCHLCGRVGHQGRDCLNPACSLCLSVGHSMQQCRWEHIEIKKCSICNMMDHLVDDCPDLWRRYHMTIAPGPIIYGNSCRNNIIYCYNCARKGHFGHDCDRERMNDDTYPTSPFISQYCEPTMNIIGKQTGRLRKLAKNRKAAINKSNKAFIKKSRYLHNKTERILKLSLNPSPVTNKKPKKKKKKNIFKNASTNQIDSSVASSSQMSSVVCSPPEKRRRKRKETPVLQQNESQQKSKIKNSKKKRNKFKNANTKTGLIQGDKNKASNGNSSSIAVNILRSLLPADLHFSMNCMNLFSGKRS